MDPNIENYVYGVGLSPVSCKEGDARILSKAPPTPYL